MTAALFWLAPGALAGIGVGADLTLDGPEGHHAVAVRRLRVGEPVLLADGSGAVAEAVVGSVGKAELTARVAALRPAARPAPRLVLAQALAKGDRDEAAIEMATELGVDEVIAWQANRSVVQWRGERGAKSLRKWENVVTAAAKQARRATIPQVSGPLTTKALVARVGSEAGSGPQGSGAQPDAEGVTGTTVTTYVLHEDATQPLATLEQPTDGDVVLVVGPEGGIAPEELAAFEAAGATPVRLGDTVLRSSSAGPAALAVICAATRWRSA